MAHNGSVMKVVTAVRDRKLDEAVAALADPGLPVQVALLTAQTFELLTEDEQRMLRTHLATKTIA